MKYSARRSLLFLAILGISVAVTSCSSAANFAPVNTNGSGLAVGGYDPVAFFAVNDAVRGDKKYEFAWNGAKWHFASAENLEKFKADPVAYAPQFGGYCSYAVSRGYTADGDPMTWKIVEGKLYLNYNQKVKEEWEKEQLRFIEDGTRNWVEFRKKKPEHKG